MSKISRPRPSEWPYDTNCCMIGPKVTPMECGGLQIVGLSLVVDFHGGGCVTNGATTSGFTNPDKGLDVLHTALSRVRC